jgi:Ran GTPase-activating protein (RanGAP) involved in mRNA processing and transport
MKKLTLPVNGKYRTGAVSSCIRYKFPMANSLESLELIGSNADRAHTICKDVRKFSQNLSSVDIIDRDELSEEEESESESEEEEEEFFDCIEPKRKWGICSIM